jgi:tetratricopeptide (TPR) repeat protein
MNNNLLNAVNALKAKDGADVLDNPGALEQHLLETAGNEPRVQIRILIMACDRDFHKEVRNAAETERAACKERLAQKFHNDEGLDLTLCRNTLDLIEAVLFGAASPVCAGCGAELKAHWKACPECGTEVGGGGASPKPADNGEKSGAAAHIALAEEYADKEDYDNAIAEYSRAIELDPNSARAFHDRGYVYDYNKDDYDQAIADYTRAIELDPNYWEAYYNRGNVYTNNKDDYERGIVDYNRAIKLNPDNAAAYAGRGFAYSKKGDHDRAVSDYNKAIELDPKNTDYYLHRGKVYYEHEEYDKALADFNKIISLEPDTRYGYILRGLVYAKTDDYDKAIADFTQDIKIDPNSAITYYERAEAYYANGDYDEAIADYNKSIELDSNHAQAFCGRGQTYRLLGKTNKAVKDFTRAIELLPDYTDAYYFRGLVAQLCNECENAINDFSKAIELSPDLAHPYYQRGKTYYLEDDNDNEDDEADKDKAKRDLNKAVKLGCTEADCYYWLGEIFMDEERWDGAIQNFNRAVNLGDGDRFTFEHRAHAYVHKENYNAAVNDFSRAIELCAEDDDASAEDLAELYNYRAVANSNLGNGAAVLADLQEAVRLDPNNSQYQDNLNNANSANSSGGCFITSAVCRSFAKPDDCYELSRFRRFRDGWLTQQPEGPALIERYYRTAPGIVAAIDRSPAPDAVYRRIWDAHLAPCLLAIENGRLEDCKRRYISMVETLGAEWGI